MRIELLECFGKSVQCVPRWANDTIYRIITADEKL